jgi:hypothetical protein
MTAEGLFRTTIEIESLDQRGPRRSLPDMLPEPED